MIEEASFEDLLLLANKDFEFEDESKPIKAPKKSKNVDEVVEDLRRK